MNVKIKKGDIVRFDNKCRPKVEKITPSGEVEVSWNGKVFIVPHETLVSDRWLREVEEAEDRDGGLIFFSCPYCSYEYHDYLFDGLTSTEDIYCDKCKGYFSVAYHKDYGGEGREIKNEPPEVSANCPRCNTKHWVAYDPDGIIKCDCGTRFLVEIDGDNTEIELRVTVEEISES